MAVGILTPPAESQESLVPVGRFQLEFPDDVNTSSFGPNTELIFDSPNRRAFHFMRGTGRTIGRVYDLDTLETAVERVYSTAEFGQLAAPTTVALANEWVHAINPKSDELALAYSSGGAFAGLNILDATTLELKRRLPWEPVTYEPPPPPEVDPQDPQLPSLPCTSQVCLPQAPTVVPFLAGMSFVDGFVSGTADKYLLLMQDGVWPPGTERNGNLAWLAQWDASSGRQDWLYNIRACSNARYQGRDSGDYMLGVFQGNIKSGIFVSCQVGGGTGQVVRLATDSLNVPQSETSYPGPQKVVDAIADTGSDRMLLKVSNEEGVSWWVFDGVAGAYVGVIGATLQPSGTSDGIDVTSGRLYTLAGPTAAENTQHPGGILLADIRRSPAPQFLTFPQFARGLASAIRIDVHPSSGERRLFAPLGRGAFEIIRDPIPISVDPLDTEKDLRTIDEPLKKGVTDVDYRGSGHAFGFRALLAGGVEGFITGGPDVGGAIRVGRWVPLMAGSPCFPNDRELQVGLVKSAEVSNATAAANAAVAEADAGSKTDIGEPTARCYPRPRGIAREDLWDTPLSVANIAPSDILGDYPQPQNTELDEDKDDTKTDLDEIFGTEWPVMPVECSGDSKADTTTRVRPFYRGDFQDDPDADPDAVSDTTRPVRHKTLEFPGWSASVACGQEGGFIEARAEIVLHEETIEQPAVEIEVPEIGTIRVGEVSTTVKIYLDPERGIVSRSAAVSRAITFGDHAAVDAAVAIAEAWAGGRPGTASTSFERRLCGISIKDEAPDVVVNRPVVNVDPNRVLAGDVEHIEVDPDGGGEQAKSVNQQFCGDPDISQLGLVQQYSGINQERPLIDVLNRVLGSRGQARLPEPDAILQQGTPGGYLASVQKDRFEEISSRAVNNDASTQVPALELVIFNDDPTEGRGRQLYQFAGVDASVAFGIYLLNPPFDPPLEDIVDDFMPLPPRVFEGTPPSETIIPGSVGPLTVFFNGVRFLFRSPLDALLAAAVWALLYSPIQMAGRRRALRTLR